MIKITLVNKDEINFRDIEKAEKMADRVDFLTPSEKEAYACVIYNAMQWGKTVR